MYRIIFFVCTAIFYSFEAYSEGKIDFATVEAKTSEYCYSAKWDSVIYIGKIALENNIERKTIPINEYTWPNLNSLILIGEESCGLQSEILDMCDDLIEIPTRGSVRSLNASVAGSLAIYDYVCKRGNKSTTND